MYNQKSIESRFHETPLGLSESMEQKNYYRARILDLHHDLEKRGIVSHTKPETLPDLSAQPPTSVPTKV